MASKHFMIYLERAYNVAFKRDQLVSEKYLVSVFSSTRVHFGYLVSFNGCVDKATDYRSSVPGFEPYHGNVCF